jgi:hypothetical protein
MKFIYSVREKGDKNLLGLLICFYKEGRERPKRKTTKNGEPPTESDGTNAVSRESRAAQRVHYLNGNHFHPHTMRLSETGRDLIAAIIIGIIVVLTFLFFIYA